MRCVDRPFVCESCEFRFEDLDSLRLHKRKMEGVCDSYCPFDSYRRQVKFPPPVQSPKTKTEPIKVEHVDADEPSEAVRNEIKREAAASPAKMDRFDPLKNDEDQDEDPGQQETEKGHFEDQKDDESECAKSPVKVPKKLREVRVRVKTISPFVNCPFCTQEYNIDEDSDAAFRLVIHVANHHPKENIKFRYAVYLKCFPVGLTESFVGRQVRRSCPINVKNVDFVSWTRARCLVTVVKTITLVTTVPTVRPY